MIDLTPLTLTGEHVQLVPLHRDHADALWAISDESIWQWTSTGVYSHAGMCQYVEAALKAHAEGYALPFTTTVAHTGEIVGSTRFGSIAREHRRVEIGWTWLTPRWQRTALNTEAKYLMLRHAFEVWDCARVEIKTDVLNTKSRAAIARLGATEEGILRQHMTVQAGRQRDTVMFSIITSEWPSVKANLESKLRRSEDTSQGGS